MNDHFADPLKILEYPEDTAQRVLVKAGLFESPLDQYADFVACYGKDNLPYEALQYRPFVLAANRLLIGIKNLKTKNPDLEKHVRDIWGDEINSIVDNAVACIANPDFKDPCHTKEPIMYEGVNADMRALEKHGKKVQRFIQMDGASQNTCFFSQSAEPEQLNLNGIRGLYNYVCLRGHESAIRRMWSAATLHFVKTGDLQSAQNIHRDEMNATESLRRADDLSGVIILNNMLG